MRSRSGSEATASTDVPPGFGAAVAPFSQLIKWPFHELKIAVESSLPVYEVNEAHPLVTVRSLDMDAISTSTDNSVLNACCLDYYLDNVMANVPELALCLHSKGYLRGIHVTNTTNVPGLTEDILNTSIDSNFASSGAASTAGKGGVHQLRVPVLVVVCLIPPLWTTMRPPYCASCETTAAGRGAPTYSRSLTGEGS